MDQSKGKPGLVVRPMRPGDAAAVAGLCGQLGYERAAEEVRRWVEGLGKRADEQVAFVACQDAATGAEVVGWVEVSLVSHVQEAVHGLIGGLVVKDGVRGGGVGRRLCREAEAWCWRQGVDMVRVTSRSTREAAHRFYLKDGYEDVKVSRVFSKRRA